MRARSSGIVGGASRLPAGAGAAGRAAAPATGGLPVEGSGQAAAPGAGQSPTAARLLAVYSARTTIPRDDFASRMRAWLLAGRLARPEGVPLKP